MNFFSKWTRKFRKIPQSYLWWAFFCFAMFSFIFGGTYFFLALGGQRNPKNVVFTPQPAQGIADAQEGKKVNFVLMGHGGANHSGGSLMDSIILISLDVKNKKALEVSIPRDLWVEGRKMNEGYVSGGFDLMKHQVNVVTGIYPENYAAIDFDNYKKAIDLLGGVDVNIVKAYEDKFYPIKGKEAELCGKSPEQMVEVHQKYSGYELETQFECRYEHIKFNAGVVHMDGETALKYVRSRHGDGDFGRSERQFVVLNGLKDKILSLGILKNFGKVFEALFESVETNMSLGEVQALANFFINDSEYQVFSIHLTDQNVLTSSKSSTGQYILQPLGGIDNWKNVKSYILSNSK